MFCKWLGEGLFASVKHLAGGGAGSAEGRGVVPSQYMPREQQK